MVDIGDGGPLDGQTGLCAIDCGLSQCISVTGAKSLHRCVGSKCPLAMDPSKGHGPLLTFKSVSDTDSSDAIEVDVLLLGIEVLGDNVETWGLLLGREDPDSHVYQRIGTVQFGELEGPKWKLGDFKAWMKVVRIE